MNHVFMDVVRSINISAAGVRRIAAVKHYCWKVSLWQGREKRKKDGFCVF
jgi:hypothetical protein